MTDPTNDVVPPHADAAPAASTDLTRDEIIDLWSIWYKTGGLFDYRSLFWRKVNAIVAARVADEREQWQAVVDDAEADLNAVLADFDEAEAAVLAASRTDSTPSQGAPTPSEPLLLSASDGVVTITDGEDD